MSAEEWKLSLPGDAVEVLPTLEIEVVIDDAGRSIEPIVERVGGEEFKCVGILENRGDAVSADEIDAARGADR